MNIISGIAKNLQLDVPKGLEVRPTSARARKSIFDSIKSWEGLSVLDLYSGSGALGLEAASRGAKAVYFSEISSLHCSFIEKNIEKVKNSGVDTALKLARGDSNSFYKTFPDMSRKLNVIFADPPYRMTAELIDSLFSDKDFAYWAFGSLFILETSIQKDKKPTVQFAENWRIKSLKTYGQSAFYFFESIISQIIYSFYWKNIFF